MIFSTKARRFHAGSALPALALAVLTASVLATPANAQDAGASTPTPPAPGTLTNGPNSPAQIDNAAAVDKGEGGNEEIVVTGTLFRRTNTETPSPVTVLTADNLAKRGITNVSDAVRSLAADSAGTLPPSFSANGAFAFGASAPSLRGLTTNSTIVLFDGLRGAFYPLADDGSRSFVDLNTIPDAIVERVEVLKDGASSLYGADAIAGVVNVITKKEIKGIEATGEAGISNRGDAGEQRFTLTGGYGDLSRQGFNVYLSAEYERDAQLFSKQRGYPFNTGNTTRTLADNGTSLGPDNNTNGTNAEGGGFVLRNGSTTSAIVFPATRSNAADPLSGVGLPGGVPQILNPAGCGAGTFDPTPGDASDGSYCEQDNVNQYGVIQPRETRFGLTGHVTVQLTPDIQAYAIGTYYQNKTYFIGQPEGTFERQPTTIRNLTLPITLPNGTLNPNNPYAADGEYAILKYNFGGIPVSTSISNRTYRGAAGVKGTFGDGWGFQADATYMRSTIDITYRGLLNYTALLAATEDGTFNFINPELNSQAQLNALSPDVKARATSDLWQVQGFVTKDLFTLPGGAVQLAVGGQARYEKINDPVQDPVDANGNYTTVGINLFNAVGHRYNEAAFFELTAPIEKWLEVDGSGRYDHYSEGFSHFSPKLGVKITPITQIAFRGTFSKGFRAPSIPESSGNVIGYVTVTPPANVIAQHLDANGNPNGYVKSYGIGEFAAGNPDLKPEKATNFTAGTIIQPVRWLSLTVDFYHIKKTGVIVGGGDYGSAINAFYNGDPIPAGYTILANPVDPDHPNATPTIQVVNAAYANANSLLVYGLDFSAQVQLPITTGVKLTSSVEANRVLRYNFTSGGVTQHYVGTLGPDNYTAGSGTPKWRGNWQNTLEAGPYTISGTAYYTDGYLGTAEDVLGAGTGHDCVNGALATSSDGSSSQKCHVKHFIDVDMTGSIKVNDNFTFYINVINIFDTKPPYDPASYSANNYNPAYAQAGIVGRYFRAGAHVKF